MSGVPRATCWPRQSLSHKSNRPSVPITAHDLDLSGKTDSWSEWSSSCCRVGAVQPACSRTCLLGWICTVQILHNISHGTLGSRSRSTWFRSWSIWSRSRSISSRSWSISSRSCLSDLDHDLSDLNHDISDLSNLRFGARSASNHGGEMFAVYTSRKGRSRLEMKKQ